MIKVLEQQEKNQLVTRSLTPLSLDTNFKVQDTYLIFFTLFVLPPDLYDQIDKHNGDGRKKENLP